MSTLIFFRADGTAFEFKTATDWSLGAESGAITVWHHDQSNPGIKYKSIVPLTAFERMTSRI